jgi:diadenosine tetraphosphate (Ap4A) HIT family hydrolase
MACDLTAGRRPLPGGLVHRTEHWLVEHCIGPLGVGTLIVKPERHVEHVANLTDAEAAELGPLLVRTAGVVTTLCRPDQVYTCLWSHGPVHIHFVVQPVSGHRRLRGPILQSLQFRLGRPPPSDDVERFVVLAAEQFAGGPTGSD